MRPFVENNNSISFPLGKGTDRGKDIGKKNNYFRQACFSRVFLYIIWSKMFLDYNKMQNGVFRDEVRRLCFVVLDFQNVI